MQFLNKGISRRQFLKYSVAGTLLLTGLPGSFRSAHSQLVFGPPILTIPTPIFRIDDVRTYDHQIGSDSYESTGASSIGPDPNPDDPPVAPGYHYYHMGVEDLLEKLARNGFPLWKSNTTYSPPTLPLQFENPGQQDDGGFGVGSGNYGGSAGLFSSDDIVIIKINAVAPAHCMVNLDVLKGFIQRLLDHPDGFTGEIVVVDKYFNDEPPNSYHSGNTVSAVCNSFPNHRVSRATLKDLVWQSRKAEDVKNGYVELEDLYPSIGTFERVSYPKFTTRYGTHIDLSLGWWNGTHYDSDRVKLVGYSVLKDQCWTSVTCCLKNFLGITNIGTMEYGGSDGDPDYGWQRSHEGIYSSGLLGRILRIVRFPQLFLVDATRILAQHPLGPMNNSAPFFQPAVLLAGFDPVNLDYYAAKNILLEQPIITPCNDVRAPGTPAVCRYNPWVSEYPCSRTGKCARHDPDFASLRRVNPFYCGHPGFQLRDRPPLDAFRRYLYQAAKALYGNVFIGPDYYYVL